MLYNFQNATIKVAAVEFLPFFTFHGKNGYGGLCFEILKALARSLNFSYEISEVISGGRLVDGKWNDGGIIKLVNESKFDLGIDAVTLTYDRYLAVDFTNSFMYDKSSILSPSPIKVSRMFAIIQVFTPEVWLLLFISIALFGPIMKLVERIRLRIDPKLLSSECVSFCRYFWLSVCMVLCKDIKSFQGSAPRIIILFWTIMMMVLVAMYSGVLLALMAQPSLSKPIDTLQDLIEARGISWGAFPSSATRSHIQNSSNPVCVEVSKRFDSNPNLMPKNFSMAIDLLRNGHYALISDEMIFSNIRMEEIKLRNECPYYVSKDYLFIEWYSFITPFNTSYLPSINTVLNRLLESGLITFWLDKQLGEKLEMCKSDYNSESSLHTLKLTDVQGAFVVLSIGVAVSYISLIIEYLVKREWRFCFMKRNRKQNKKRRNLKF